MDCFSSVLLSNARFPLINGLLIGPDGVVPEGKEKINLKIIVRNV